MKNEASRRGLTPKDRDPVLRLTELVERAKTDIRRFVIDDPNFLPKNTTPLGGLLDRVEVLGHDQYVKRLIAAQVSISMPANFASELLGNEKVQKKYRACTIHGLTDDEQPTIILDAGNIAGDTASPANATFIEQLLTEELAHCYYAGRELGPLSRLPKESANYWPMQSTSEVSRFISGVARPMYGINSPYNPNSILVQGQGCRLMYSEMVAREGGKRKVTYPSPRSSDAPEELRASFLQNIFMAKIVARSTQGGTHAQLVTGFRQMNRAGMFTRTKGYNGQAIGAAIVAEPILNMGNNENPDDSVKGALQLLHDCDFEKLCSSVFGRHPHFNDALKAFVDNSA